MTTPSTSVVDPTHASLLHLHHASQSLLPLSQALSSHLSSTLLHQAFEHDIKLPKSYIESRFCQRCGTVYVPGVTCSVRSVQSRRQRRARRDWEWVVYECSVCKGAFRSEVEVPRQRPPAEEEVKASGSKGNKVVSTEKAVNKDDTQIRIGKRRKRERFSGLRTAIEKSKSEKTKNTTLSLLDLMKPT